MDHFDGESWAPDDRDASRRVGVGRIDAGYEILADEQVRQVTAINTGRFTSPYLPVPYAPDAVNGLDGRWSWDPATLSIKGVDTNSRNQQYVVQSTVPRLTAGAAGRSPRRRCAGISEEFIRPPSNVPDIVRSTADTVTEGEPARRTPRPWPSRTTCAQWSSPIPCSPPSRAATTATGSRSSPIS